MSYAWLVKPDAMETCALPLDEMASDQLHAPAAKLPREKSSVVNGWMGARVALDTMEYRRNSRFYLEHSPYRSARRSTDWAIRITARGEDVSNRGSTIGIATGYELTIEESEFEYR
jgi:hypothetical protein